MQTKLPLSLVSELFETLLKVSIHFDVFPEILNTRKSTNDTHEKNNSRNTCEQKLPGFTSFSLVQLCPAHNSKVHNFLTLWGWELEHLWCWLMLFVDNFKQTFQTLYIGLVEGTIAEKLVIVENGLFHLFKQVPAVVLVKPQLWNLPEKEPKWLSIPEQRKS